MRERRGGVQVGAVRMSGIEGERNWMVGSGEWAVTLEGNQLMVQRTGQEKAPL